MSSIGLNYWYLAGIISPTTYSTYMFACSNIWNTDMLENMPNCINLDWRSTISPSVATFSSFSITSLKSSKIDEVLILLYYYFRLGSSKHFERVFFNWYILAPKTMLLQKLWIVSRCFTLSQSLFFTFFYFKGLTNL